MESADLASLLARIATIAEKDAEHRRKAGLDFNVFRLCGVHHYETRHSAILSALLDPSGMHGMGDVFLKLFLSGIGEDKLTVSPSTHVKTEVPILIEGEDDKRDRRLDILIEDDESKWSVVIENKIFALEGNRQVGDYRKWLDRKRTNWTKRLIFLTLDGRAPKTDSGSDNSDTVLLLASWATDILPWLRNCHRDSVDRPYIRESIAQYMILVKQLTEQSDMDSEETREIIKLTTKDITAFRGYVELLRSKGAVFGQIAIKIADALHSRLTADSSKTWGWVKSSQDPFSATDRTPFIFVRHARLGFRVRISPEQSSLHKVFVGIGSEDTTGSMITPEALREKLRSLPRWQSNQYWIGWSYLPADILNWDGDFLADFINGDKRDVVNRIWEILDNIGGAV